MVVGPTVDLHMKKLWDTTMQQSVLPKDLVFFGWLPGNANDVKDSLWDSHKKYLTCEFGLTFE